MMTLTAAPDVLTEAEIRSFLGPTRLVGRELRCFEELDSTNNYLKGLAQGGGDLPHLRREVLLPLGHVDADAQHQGLDPPRLRLQGQLRQNAAELLPAEHRVVGPFQPRPGTADPLHGGAHRPTGVAA